jgi:hypothetical protein
MASSPGSGLGEDPTVGREKTKDGGDLACKAQRQRQRGEASEDHEEATWLVDGAAHESKEKVCGGAGGMTKSVEGLDVRAEPQLAPSRVKGGALSSGGAGPVG